MMMEEHGWLMGSMKDGTVWSQTEKIAFPPEQCGRRRPSSLSKSVIFSILTSNIILLYILAVFVKFGTPPPPLSTADYLGTADKVFIHLHTFYMFRSVPRWSLWKLRERFAVSNSSEDTIISNCQGGFVNQLVTVHHQQVKLTLLMRQSPSRHNAPLFPVFLLLLPHLT